MAAQDEIDRKILSNATDSVTGSTPLMYATIENRMQIMERLMGLGSDINKKNKENYTALHFGGSTKKIEILLLLTLSSQRVCIPVKILSTGCWPREPTPTSLAGLSNNPPSTLLVPEEVVKQLRWVITLSLSFPASLCAVLCLVLSRHIYNIITCMADASSKSQK